MTNRDDVHVHELEVLPAESVCRLNCRFNCGALVSRVPKGSGDTFAGVLQRRLSRRDVLRVGLVAGAAAAFGPTLDSGPSNSLRLDAAAPAVAQAGLITFSPIPPDTSDRITLAEGYRSQVVLAWGDPLFPDMTTFDLNGLTAADQERRFGFNSDFVAYLPLPLGSNSPDEGLLWNNHEYTDGLMMFAGYDPKNPTREQVDVELAAHGASIVQVRRDGGGFWEYDRASTFNRRITATTPMWFWFRERRSTA